MTSSYHWVKEQSPFDNQKFRRQKKKSPQSNTLLREISRLNRTDIMKMKKRKRFHLPLRPFVREEKKLSPIMNSRRLILPQKSIMCQKSKVEDGFRSHVEKTTKSSSVSHPSVSLFKRVATALLYSVTLRCKFFVYKF